MLDLDQLTDADREKLLLSTSFYDFFRYVWPILNPSAPLQDNWHIECIAEHLQAVSLGQITRLIVNVPPRSSKSTLCTITWPVWHWLHSPWAQFMFASYSQSLSTKHSMDRRTLIESDGFRRHFADAFELRHDQNQKTKFETTQRGSMFATSVLGSYTGEGADYLVIDDPHSPKIAESEALRPATLEAFDVGLSTRLNNKKTGAIVLVMQRLHELDLTGHILQKEQGWAHLKFPAVCEQLERHFFPLSGAIQTREPGEFLHSAREGTAEIAELRTTLGSYGFAGQYQQSPSPSGGGILKAEYWRMYDEAPADFDRIIISGDLRFKDDKNSGAYVAFAVLGKRGPDIYLLDMRRGRWSFTQTKNELIRVCTDYPKASAKYIEDKANGPAVVDDLRTKIQGLILCNPQGAKTERAHAITPLHEAGNLYIPRKAPWLEAFLYECALFPNGAHDDQVDAYTQGVLQMRDSALDYLRAMATH